MVTISNKFSQFKGSPSLLIVSAWQDGKVFYVSDGEIEFLKEIKVPNHEYSDNEGYFETSSGKPRNSFSVSGSVREGKKWHIRGDFLRRFTEYLNNLDNQKEIRDVYLFTPKRGLDDLEKKMPYNLKKKIKGLYYGSYTKSKELELLEVIKKNKPKPVEVVSDEVREILEKGKN